jgi:hypothetical protein
MWSDESNIKERNASSHAVLPQDCLLLLWKYNEEGYSRYVLRSFEMGW